MDPRRAWTQAERDAVLALSDTMTAAQIAPRYGVSRNAILGLVARERKARGMNTKARGIHIGCTGSLHGPTLGVSSLTAPDAASNGAHSGAFPAGPQPADAVRLEDRRGDQCAWPLWGNRAGPGDADYGRMCGAPVVRGEQYVSPYCAHHQNGAHTVRRQPGRAAMKGGA